MLHLLNMLHPEGEFSTCLLNLPLVMESFFSDKWSARRIKLLFGRKSLCIFNMPTKYFHTSLRNSPPPPNPTPILVVCFKAEIELSKFENTDIVHSPCIPCIQASLHEKCWLKHRETFNSNTAEQLLALLFFFVRLSLCWLHLYCHVNKKISNFSTIFAHVNEEN